jgi:Zn-dependent protease with chaperone function
MKVKLHQLEIPKIQFKEERDSIERLNAIPGFKSFTQKTAATLMEKYADVEYTAEGVNVNDQSMPTLYDLLLKAVDILGSNELPNFSTDWSYSISSFSVGDKSKRIVLQSGSVDLLSEGELFFMLGHELGHILCGHKIYHMLTECLYMPLQNSPELKIWMNLIRLPLLNWYRMSDFSADRFGLLCCQDINVALSAMIKMAGLPHKYYNQINIESFKIQARDFERNFSSTIDKLIKIFSINAAMMPWQVVRASQLMSWFESGEYDNVININR